MIENYFWLAAGGMCLLTAFVHLIAGHYSIVKPFIEASVSMEVKSTLYACWHMVTVALFVSSFAYFWASSSEQEVGLVSVISAMFVLFSVCFILVARYLFPNRSLMVLPQWLLLLPVGLLGFAGVGL